MAVEVGNLSEVAADESRRSVERPHYFLAAPLNAQHLSRVLTVGRRFPFLWQCGTMSDPSDNLNERGPATSASCRFCAAGVEQIDLD